VSKPWNAVSYDDYKRIVEGQMEEAFGPCTKPIDESDLSDHHHNGATPQDVIDDMEVKYDLCRLDTVGI
jgi:hypothetical protein